MMKKILSNLIVLAVLLTGYCPSVFNAQENTATQMSSLAHSTVNSHQSQMNCCDQGMQQVTTADLIVSNQKKNTQAHIATFFIRQPSTPLQTNQNWRLRGHNSSPPHLNLTGITIMRE